MRSGWARGPRPGPGSLVLLVLPVLSGAPWLLAPRGGQAAGAAPGCAKTYDSLVLEGGGVKGAVYSGALQALDEAGLLSGIRNFGGTSAGASVAALLAAGYTACELKEQTFKIRFTDLVDFSLWPRIRDALFGKGMVAMARKLRRTKGFFHGHHLVSTIDKLIARKMCATALGVSVDEILAEDLLEYSDDGEVTGGQEAGRCAAFRHCSFQRLHEATGTELSLSGFDITNGTLVYFNRHTSPHMPVSKAVRVSSSIPLIFEPVEYQGHLFLDGGVMRRLPIDAFPTDATMLALKIGKDFKEISPAELKDMSVGSYTRHLFHTILKTTQDLDIVQRAKRRGVHFVDFSTHPVVKGVDGLEFDMYESTKVRMFAAGYDVMRDHISTTACPGTPRRALRCAPVSCGDLSNCSWFEDMRKQAQESDAGRASGGMWTDKTILLKLLGLCGAAVLFSALITLARNGFHLLMLNSYSGIRTQRCTTCLRMWVPSELPAHQIQSLTDEELWIALKCRGLLTPDQLAAAEVYPSLRQPTPQETWRVPKEEEQAMRAKLRRAVYLENIGRRRLMFSGGVPRKHQPAPAVDLLPAKQLRPAHLLP